MPEIDPNHSSILMTFISNNPYWTYFILGFCATILAAIVNYKFKWITRHDFEQELEAGLLGPSMLIAFICFLVWPLTLIFFIIYFSIIIISQIILPD
jgi:hypothetical protein